MHLPLRRTVQRLDAAVVQNLIRHIVAVVDQHHAGTDAERVGPVAPLLPFCRNRACAAAADQLHPLQMQILLQNVLQRRLQLPRPDCRLSPAGQLIHAERAQNTGVDGEFVRVHLRKNGIQMHERARSGNLEGKDGCDRASLVGKYARCQTLDCLRLRPLGHADGKHAFAQIQNVAAFDREMLLRRIIERHLPGKFRVILEDIASVDRLAVSRGGVHAVETHAPADAGKRVARKIEIRNRRHEKARFLAHQT